jgi:hypothetical protein
MMRRIFAFALGIAFVLPAGLEAAKMSEEEQLWYDQVRILMTADERVDFKDRPKKRPIIQRGFWEDGTLRAQILGEEVSPAERERVWMKRAEYAGKEFGGEAWVTEDKKEVSPPGWETQRGFLFCMGLGPPMARYVNWEQPPPVEKMDPKILTTVELFEYLKEAVAEDVQEDDPDAGKPSGGLGGLSLGGGLGGLSLPGGSGDGEAPAKPRVERWIYPVGGSEKFRVFTFVEREPGGQVAVYSHEMRTRASAAKGEEVTYRDAIDPWWPRSAVMAECEKPPTLEGAGDLTLTSLAFGSEAPGRTHVRAVAWIGEDGVESAFGPGGLVGARAWATVLNDNGDCVDQSIIESLAASDIGKGDPTVVETALELEPGSYELQYVIAKSGGEGQPWRGAAASARLDVPDLESGLSMSTPILTASVKEGPRGFALLPASEAPAVQVASKAGGAPSPGPPAFVYGKYYMVPMVAGEFTTDQVLALALVVYNAKKAVVNYTFYYDDENAGEWEPDTVTPRTGGNLVRITPLEGFPAGKYEIRINVKDDKTNQEAESSAFFEIVE